MVIEIVMDSFNPSLKSLIIDCLSTHGCELVMVSGTEYVKTANKFLYPLQKVLSANAYNNYNGLVTHNDGINTMMNLINCINLLILATNKPDIDLKSKQRDPMLFRFTYLYQQNEEKDKKIEELTKNVKSLEKLVLELYESTYYNEEKDKKTQEFYASCYQHPHSPDTDVPGPFVQPSVISCSRCLVNAKLRQTCECGFIQPVNKH